MDELLFFVDRVASNLPIAKEKFKICYILQVVWHFFEEHIYADVQKLISMMGFVEYEL